MTQSIFISGASSAMAQAYARRHASLGARFYLLARSADKLEVIKQDLLVRGAQSVVTQVVDMAETQNYAAIVDKAVSALGAIDIALLAQGVMYKQEDLQNNTALIRGMYQVNLLSAIELLSALANYFEQQKKGSLLVISSVAGDRGRQSNYVYGATKAALSVFTDGLRNRLHRHGVTVVTVKPGFVDTPMTQDLEKGGPLWATPEKIAEDMDKTIAKGGAVLYTPWFWRYIMLIIKHIPEFIFRKMSL